MSAPLAEKIRGGIVDDIHRGDVAVVSADGALLGHVGEPREKRVFWRSAAKPFQAMPLVASGAAARFGFSSNDIALTTASHGGEPIHVDRAATMLERVGFTVDDLECGADLPLDPEAAQVLLRRDGQPSALHNTCSGKHIGMLALAEHLGEPHGGYRFPEHPVQLAVLENIARFSGVPADEVWLGLDGCGVPAFGTSVFHLALAFARLMAPDEHVDESFASAAGAVSEAMLDHPYLVAGRLRTDTELMQAVPGRLVAKVGAGGVQCIGLRDGIGIAVKIEDGAAVAALGQPAGVVALEVLRQLGELDEPTLAGLGRHARPQVETVAGEVAGELRPAFTLEGLD
jgi:L-asparaginase II